MVLQSAAKMIISPSTRVNIFEDYMANTKCICPQNEMSVEPCTWARYLDKLELSEGVLESSVEKNGIFCHHET